MIDWTPFNDDHTLIGIEGRYTVKGGKLIVFVEPTNSIEDWLSNFTAFPVLISLTDIFLGFCHAGYRRYAYWLMGMIWSLKNECSINEIVLIGYSMGGGICQIAGVMCKTWFGIKTRVVSIDGPRTTTILPEGIVYYNGGSLVHSIPPWFKKLPGKKLVQIVRPFWEAHADYDKEKLILKETQFV